MITPEEAEARLGALRDPRWRAAAGQRIDGLPARLRELAAPFVFSREALAEPWTRHEESQRQLAAARELDGLPGDERAEVMTALHPGLGAALARWWTDAMDRPYQQGWDRRAFRAPSAPGLTVGTRATGLAGLVAVAGPYDADPVWLAVWAAHLAAREPHLATDLAPIGGLLASAINLGGRVAADTLAALAEVGNGEHPVGMMGRHVIVALLGADRVEGWDFIERLLLAAQLQEGLRQSILEAADEGHPGAFDRMLNIVLDSRLLRFTAAVRAVGVWLGFGASVADIPLIEARAGRLREYRGSREARAAALAGDDPWDAYIALSAGGMRDVLATIPEAQKLAQSSSPGMRAVAVAYAAAAGLPEAQPLLAAAIDDPDIRVAALAAYRIGPAGLTLPATFDALARLITRVPARARDESGFGVQHAPIAIGQAEIARVLISALGTRPVRDLLPWLPVMDAWGRDAVAAIITGEAHGGCNRPRPAELTPETRPVLIGMLGDRSTNVRATALRGLARSRLEPAEAPAIEALLTRAATDVRRGALTLLTSLPRGEARACAARLAASKDKRQQEAAAELLREIGGAGATGDQGGAAAPPDSPHRHEKDTATQAAPRSPATTEAAAIQDAAAEDAASESAPIENLHVTLRSSTPRTAPRPRELRKPDPRAAGILTALDEVAAAHRDVPVRITWWQGTEERLLGDVGEHMFPVPFGGPGQVPRRDQQDDAERAPHAMVLGEVFLGWWARRPGSLRGGGDGLDALRAHILALPRPEAWNGPVHHRHVRPAGTDAWDDTERRLAGNPPDGIRHHAILRHVTGWLVAEHLDAGVIDECLDALEATLALVPPDVLATPPEDVPGVVYRPANHLPAGDWRLKVRGHSWYALLHRFLHGNPAVFTPAQVGRWYRLMRWVERPHPGAQPLMVDEQLLALAHAVGVASDDDAAVAFLFPGSQLFKDLTRHWRTSAQVRHPGLIPVASRLRDQLVAVEARRGDLPTPTSLTARNIGGVRGVAVVARLLAALGETPLTRGWGMSQSKDDVLSHLVRVSFPAPGESGQDLAAAAGRAGLPDARLVDLALFAPQWATLTEEALRWPGLAEAVLWLHAHTRDRQWAVDAELADSWAAMAAERTGLSAEDLLDGAVDVDWFRRVHQTLGPARWAVVHKAAKLASGGTGHARAKLYAEAMLGEADEDALVPRITRKRYQDAVRALGLLPLPDDPAARRERVQRRYTVLREFERGSKAFGQMRQASERTAVRIAVENLARTAGYADPLRFTWALEAQEAGDLADGPVTVTAGEVEVTLSVDGEGLPGLAVRRAGKALKAVPAAARKDPAVAALQARKAALGKQATRVRESLEAAMVAQDAFTPEDFAELRGHPVVAPMLAQLVWVSEDGETGQLDALSSGGAVRIAHPVNLAADGSWVSWQERLFTDGRRQPFKQVFRELYVRTAQELAESPVSRRYAGHQLQPRQAMALFGRRGWVTSWESGDVARAFHRHGLAAHVTFVNGVWSPVESDLPTIDGVYFTRRGEHLAQPLASVPEVVFAEAMRDLDLVVSVAHAGGVDPEATASTTEMRAALIRETARLLKLANIEPAGPSHVLIRGQLGEYSLHLGSGTVHRRPGGAVCIIPVGSQHRGRLFLPFADDDPKTAEIVSKALLLARDHEIKDPTILEQLRS